MNTDRIKEIQQETPYPESVSVQQALLKVWNETGQEQLRIGDVMLSFLNFVRQQKPTMVNHGDKINLFELEQLIDKFKNGA